MKTLAVTAFQRWARTSTDNTYIKELKQAVIYTRVSSKEQQDTNLSLEFQKKTILDYASRNEFTIVESFGGKFESAKTDGRKEFNRMLNFIKSKKGKISHILVYTTSRFSRTGGGAIALAEELLAKYGVQILAVTQPTDTTTANGQFQQNIQLLFAQWDNQQRKQATMAGTLEKLENGIWCLTPPMGYSAITTNGVRTIVINEVGEHLKKAFKWRLAGVKNEEILMRLKALGVTIYKQKLSMIFSNPFYAGIVINRMLNGRVVKGKHPALITEAEFLRLNEIRQEAGGKFGVFHNKERDMLPLKAFVKCDKCSRPYTGYLVKKKNIYYYKCQTIGCKCNRNAQRMNNEFLDFIATYSLKEELVSPLQYHMQEIYNKMNEADINELKELERKLDEVNEAIDNIEESYYVRKKMSEDAFNKFMPKYAEEKTEILKSISRCKMEKSNLVKYLDKAITISRQLATVWNSASIDQKELLQKLIFPEGIYYNLEKGQYRTEKVNAAFSLFASLNSICGENKKGQNGVYSILSSQVGAARFELATSCSQSRRDNRATLRPEPLKKA